MVEASSPLTLIVDENTESCAALTCELGLLSRNAVAVHTPLDAISWLHADGVCVESIAVGTKFADMDGLDLLEFVALDFPTVRRVLIVQGDQDLQRTADAAHAVLKEPWGREALERAFPAEAP